MAGPWIKMECATPDKPEVFNITAKMGWDDPDITVGKLFKIWRWFDQQTLDGNAGGVTLALLDRITGVRGFAQAMGEVGWLNVTDEGVVLPGFERHNGETAKKRALTAKRVTKARRNSDGNADSNADSNGNRYANDNESGRAGCNAGRVTKSVTPALTREREEIDNNKKEIKNKTLIPSNFYPDEAVIAYALERDLEVEEQFQAFKDYHTANNSKWSDWLAVWRTWCRKAVEYRENKLAYKLKSPASLLANINYKTGITADGHLE